MDLLTNSQDQPPHTELSHNGITQKHSVESDSLLPSQSWNYNICSASAEWGKNFPDANGQKQSPINLMSKEAIYNETLGSLETTYPPVRDLDIINNGKRIILKPKYRREINKMDSRGVLRGGPCPSSEEYELSEIHFHWGKEDNRGSEHTINFKSYPMEVQFLHHNSRYNSLQEAYKERNGIVISSMFVMACRENIVLQPVLSLLEQIQYKDDSVTYTGHFNPESLLPDARLRDYWTYEGSLTFPPCSEEVTWVIYRYPMTVSLEQLEEFRRLRNHEKYQPPSVPLDDGFLVDNFRYTQAINGRTIWSSFET